MHTFFQRLSMTTSRWCTYECWNWHSTAPSALAGLLVYYRVAEFQKIDDYSQSDFDENLFTETICNSHF